MQEYLQLLSQFIAFRSISTDPAFREDIIKTAQWLHGLLEEANFETRIFTDSGNPIVYGSYTVDPSAKTILIYGHYDVQPADREDGWSSEPFVLNQKDGRLYARGVVDNKGQILIYIHTVLEAINNKTLAYNIKFVIEGDEETGGHGVGEVIAKNKDLFACDHVLISDGEMPYQPVITASFRGILNVTVTYKTANNNLHSGLFGGAVPNAGEEMARLVATLHTDDYHVTIPDFYSDDVEATPQEKQATNYAHTKKVPLLENLGIRQFFFSEDGKFPEKIGFHSMMTVTGMKSGYIGAGYANIVPNTAEARFNFRLASNQDPLAVYEKFKQFVTDQTPDYVDVHLSEPQNTAHPIRININTPMHREVFALLKDVYEKDVLVEYCGAIIPVVGDIQHILGVEPVLVSLANDDCNMHGVDENFSIRLIEKGLQFARQLLTVQDQNAT